MRRSATLALVLVTLSGALLSACGARYERREPLGEPFPSVSGRSLAGRDWRLPDDLAGRPVLLLVGYEQQAQFDIDRWLLGLSQLGLGVETYELPTIPGLLPGLFAGKIDQGMRSGIPQEDWVAVITVYDDGERVARFTGNRNGLTGRVLLLDATGRVAWFHDRGYSVASLRALERALSELEPAGGESR